MKKKQLILYCTLLFVISGYTQSSWDTWTKYPDNPVYSHSDFGAWDVASDPAAIKDGDNYKMIVSGDASFAAGSEEGNSILLATSTNGYDWNTLDNDLNGMVVTGEVGAWDESMEMPEFMKIESVYSIFYCGYDPAVRDSSEGFVWGDMGLATSTDGINFTKMDDPVMSVTANWYDQDGITDMTIVEKNDTLFMLYVGWCTRSCSLNGGEPALYLLKAISINNGLSWTKLGLLTEEFSPIGLHHPDLVLNPDGKYALFYGVDEICDEYVGIYQAIADHPFGPYTEDISNPIICMGTQDFETSDGGFPTVINDAGSAKMYYTGVNEETWVYKIGLIESNEVVSIHDTSDKTEKLIIYPNPSLSNQINMVINGEGEYIIQIFNSLGEIQEVKIASISNNKEVIQFSNLAAGINFIQIFKDNELIGAKKFIVNL